MNPTFEEWLSHLPQEVQDAAVEFPLTTRVIVGNEVFYLCSYGQDEVGKFSGITVSPIDPRVDYEGSLQDRRFVCVEHLRTQAFGCEVLR